MGGSRQGVALVLTPTVSTFAGLSSLNTNADGTGGAASFNAPLASVSDGTNLYIADSANNTIRKVVIATGVVTTLAGSSVISTVPIDGTGTAATFNAPSGITISPDFSNLYVADTGNHSIRRISLPSVVVTTLAGTGVAGYTSSGLGNVATFNNPSGITTDGTNLYIADTTNRRIREIAASGVGVTLANMASSTAAVTTLAGTGGSGTTEGAATNAKFNSPLGITTDGLNLYVADTFNHRIRKIAPTGALSGITSATATVSTLAGPSGGVAGGGSGSNEGTGTGAQFNLPTSIITDGVNIYVADNGNNKIRQVVISGGVIGATTSLTGAANTAGAIGYMDGTASTAMFGIQAPNAGLYGVSISPNGKSLFVMDTDNNIIRQITADNAATLSSMTSATVTTLAGVSPYNNPTDGTGLAARLGKSQYSTSDGTNLYVTECGPNAAVIRKVVIATGVATTLAGSAVSVTPADGTGTAASFQCPQGITTDGTNLYVTDSVNNTVRMISASGVGATLSAMTSANAVVTTLVGTGTLSAPYGITTDGINLYVADSGNNTVRKIAASGVGATLSNLTSASAVVTSITTASLTGDFAEGVPAAAASFTAPYGITTNGKSLFVADRGNNKIRMIAPTGGAVLGNISAASAVVSSITGASGVAVTAGFDNGSTAASASFNLPGDITTDGINLYVVDFNNNRIRKIAPTGGATLANITAASAVVSSITGASGVTGVNVLGYADGPGAAATFNGPTGITTDGTSLFVIDGSLGDPIVSGFTSGTIRKIR
jgi:DNA-binding beta-propeller fold protein YncE